MDEIFKLTSSETNSLALPGSPSISSGETVYTTSGVVDEFLQETISIRNPPPPPIPIINNITNITNEITEVNILPMLLRLYNKTH